MSTRSVVGAVLMVVGSLGFLMAVSPNVTELVGASTAPSVLLLTLGTYLVGTDMSGRPV